MIESKHNAEYWRSRSGERYREQQAGRTESGSQEYRQQEHWLRSHLASLAAGSGRPLRALDFGCGFGRLARFLADEPGVEYYGYDFSEPMVAPLYDDPPSGLDPIRERVRVAPSLSEAFGEQRFDVIFTISVLIHNAPEDARSLVDAMLRMLSPNGRLILVENSLSALSMKENNWHAGCWLHNIAEDLVPDSDLDVYAGVVDHHAIYVARASSGGMRSLRLSENGGELRPIDADRLSLLGLERLRAGVSGLERELADSAAVSALAHDEYEVRQYQDKLVAELRSQVDELRQGLRVAERERDQARMAAFDNAQKFEQRSQLRRQIALEALREPEPDRGLASNSGQADETAPSGFYEWQAAQDRAFAHQDDRFEHVVHVFHMEWKGIRAAAGALPGFKLAIRSDRAPSAPELESLIALLRERSIDKVVLHGMSDSMALVHKAMEKEGIAMFLVWHGTTAQWVWKDERRFALMALRLAKSGRVRRFSAIRRGLEEVAGAAYFLPQLLNPVPRIPALRTPAEANSPKRGRTALVPSWNDLRKNLASNILALEGESRIGKTLVFAKDFSLPAWLSKKVSWVRYPGAHGIGDMLRGCDLVMNVTTIDCHPMVDLEAIAVGVPSVRGPLFLDALEDHPYFALSCVANPLSVADIRRCVSAVLDVPEKEMRGMIADYATRLTRLSLDRYAEFVGV